MIIKIFKNYLLHIIDVDEELEENRGKIKLLEENTKTKDTRIKTLKKLKEKKENENEIDDLKEENFSFKSKLQLFKNKFTLSSQVVYLTK